MKGRNYILASLVLLSNLVQAQDWRALRSEANDYFFSCKNGALLYQQEIIKQTNGSVISDFVKFDPVAWLNLPKVSHSEILALIVDGNDLSVKDKLNTKYHLTVNHAAKWNGISWVISTKRFQGTVTSFSFCCNGKLHANGDFSIDNSSSSTCSLEWNGVKWFRNFQGECW